MDGLGRKGTRVANTTYWFRESTAVPVILLRGTITGGWEERHGKEIDIAFSIKMAEYRRAAQ